MRFLPFISIIALAVACAQPKAAAPYDVVPMPQEISLVEGAEPFVLDRCVCISYPQGDELLKRNAEFLSEYIAQSTGYELKVVEQDACAGKTIELALNAEVVAPEGYVLTVAAEGVKIEGSTAQGVFYGVQTLRKSLPARATKVELAAARVADAPRFEHRAMHLDVGRHFFPVEFVKRYIDLLALHNMNTFHWHLTEDQGWRFPVEKYPKLTEIGGYRNRTVVGYIDSGVYDSTRYGGYYTKAELLDVVQYASERYINIIPEVDMPGHMLAALAAYPELGCTGGPYEVSPDWGIFDDVLCIGNDATFEFLEAVFDELTEIFPYKYIHVGGDECPRVRWQACPKCQERIKAEGLTAMNGYSAEDALQSYTTRRIEKYLNDKGRVIIGWDEILHGEVAPNAVVMSWQGTAGGIKAAQMGHKVIMAPNTYCYFDYYQTGDRTNEPLAIGGDLPVEKVYSFEPTESLTEEQAQYILGVQANLWTEYISTVEYAEYMALPRMGALAEVQWTQPELKDYKGFVPRLQRLMGIYERDGYNYGKHILGEN